LGTGRAVPCRWETEGLTMLDLLLTAVIALATLRAVKALWRDG
jgi:hypothetical protein